MRGVSFALVVLLLPGASASALAQRVIYLPENGHGDKLVIVSELPPVARAAVQTELGDELEGEPKVAFLYYHYYFFHPSFDFWTRGGRFVLSDRRKYWDLPRENLVQLLGPDGEDKLSTPLAYRIPPGLATVVVLIAALAVAVYWSPLSRAQRLFRDEKYREALQYYNNEMPVDTLPTAEDRHRGMATALQWLANAHAVPAAQAEKNLKRLVNQMDLARSNHIRQIAVEHEQDGNFEQAIAFYQMAAQLREPWDQEDYQFLLKCIQRVQARAK